MNFLKSKGYIDDNGIINVKNLVGSEQALGNGESTDDVYKIERISDNYVLKYYENSESNEILYEIKRDSSEIDWEEVFANAQKPAEQTESEDIGVDSNGDPVNMDYWYSICITDENQNRYISLSRGEIRVISRRY